ncbi:MAG: hypothetical protein ILM98_12025, partial [Kiritimatiellae bacterium]|nr:hypothetical protein [Kiritimatiellia bacterium]
MLIIARDGMLTKHQKVAPAIVSAGGIVLDRKHSKAVIEKDTPMFFMEKSIEVMRSSISEARTDSKPTPCVGAVVVFPDGKFDTAFRGELREGDHAEYTLLERKHRSDNLTGCTLYATLEPCAPGSRHKPKLGCAERIVNARIKKVYIGIEDPDPMVAGKGLKYLKDNGIEVEMYPRDLQKKIEDANKDFLAAALDRARQDSSGTEATKVKQGIEYAVSSVAIGDLSKVLLRQFAERVHLNFDEAEIFNRQLVQIGILERDNDGYNPTGVGYLLFGEQPQLRYHQACINCLFQRDGYQEDIYKIDGPLLTQPQKLYEWYQARIPGQTDRSQPERNVRLDYPVEVINELVKNAILHRDYAIEGAPIYFIIREDEIIIKSPGLPPSPINFESIKNFSAPSLSRNPKIMFVFEAMKLAEQRGLGFDTVRNLRSKYNLPLPTVTYEKPYIVFTLPRNNKSSVVAEHTEGEQRILEILRLTGRKTRSEIEQRIPLGPKTITRIFNSLVKKGLVVKVGGGRSTSYILKSAYGEHKQNVDNGPLSQEFEFHEGEPSVLTISNNSNQKVQAKDSGQGLAPIVSNSIDLGAQIKNSGQGLAPIVSNSIDLGAQIKNSGQGLAP